MTRIVRLAVIPLVLLLSPPWAGSQELGASLGSDLSYLGLTLWDDAKTVARAPLEIGKLSEVTNNCSSPVSFWEA